MFAGIILGLITFIGFIAVFHKAPWYIRWFIKKFPFLSDLIVSAGAFLLLGNITGSLPGAIGAGLAGILFSGYLWWEGNKEKWKNQPSPQPSQLQQSPPQ